MSLGERLVRLAAAVLPKEQREIRLEEWSADLAHCGELGITRRQVVLGALHAGFIDGLGWRTPLGRSRWLATGSIIVALAVLSVPVGIVIAFMTTQLRGVVTVETGADGAAHEVHWKGYPGKVQHEFDGYRELDPDAVLAGPSAEQGWEGAQALLTEIETALTAEFGLTWPANPNGTSWDYHEHPTSNGYGGQSLLVVLNSPGSQSTTVPDGWPAQQRVIEIVAAVAAGHGYGSPILDFERPWFDADEAAAYGGDRPETAALIPGTIEGPHGQWLMFSIEDPSKAAGGTGDGDWSPGISLSWGATLLPHGARDEFRARLSAFEGYPRPEPLVSD